MDGVVSGGDIDVVKLWCRRWFYNFPLGCEDAGVSGGVMMFPSRLRRSCCCWQFNNVPLGYEDSSLCVSCYNVP